MIFACQKQKQSVPIKMQGSWCPIINNIKKSPDLTIKEFEIIIWNISYQRHYKYKIKDINIFSSNDSLVVSAHCLRKESYFLKNKSLYFKAVICNDTLRTNINNVNYVGL
jgi:hypothetical protein